MKKESGNNRRERTMRKIIIVLLAMLMLSMNMAAQVMTLTLDSCRALAVNNNKELRMADKKVQAAYYERKAAFTKYLPRVTATGTYTYTSKELSLLSDEQKETFSNVGTTVSAMLPQLSSMSTTLNGLGAGLVDALHTDTRNTTVGSVLLTQPLYMGGKIAAYNRITQYAEKIAHNSQDLSLQDVIVEVDEAYWRIVALQTKKKLAESYLKLVEKLDSDVQQIISAGMGTKADGLSVKVKVNEARVAMIQVTNGLSISQMLLCQICGLPLDSHLLLTDENPQSLSSPGTSVDNSVQTAWTLRPELRSLELATKIAKEKVKIARAAYLPNVALSGGYLASNPSVFNSFERKFKGMWNVGVVVSVPLVTCGERIYKVKAEQAEAEAVSLRLAETREKVELQVNQNHQKVEEATERLNTAERSQAEADENLRYATLGLKEGVIPVSNVLEAQTAWLSAHSECVTARIDLRLANLYLNKSIGTLTYK
jgi:outer membrane protein